MQREIIKANIVVFIASFCTLVIELVAHLPVLVRAGPVQARGGFTEVERTFDPVSAIAEAARELYARVVKFTEHFEKIRAGLERANGAFNDAAASFQTRVRPAGERLAERALRQRGQIPESVGSHGAELFQGQRH